MGGRGVKIQLLGTGSADGWPRPACVCASCRSAARQPRRPAAVLIDDLIRLGAGSDLSERLPAGRMMQLQGWQITALAGSHPARPVFDLVGPNGVRVVYADSTGPLPDATVQRLAGAKATALLLEETAGRHEDSRDRHLGLETFPAELVRLRANRVIEPGSTVLAVGLGHDNPPPDELAELLGCWGVQLPSDGQIYELDAGAGAAAAPAARRTLVIGGTRSGKSQWAERRLAADLAVSYVATAATREDTDWSERIRLHRMRRPTHWQTIQTSDLASVLASDGRARHGSLLIDDLGNWVARAIDLGGGWDGDLVEFREVAESLVRAWGQFPGRVVLVSNDVGGGVHPTTKAGRVFSDEMGRLNNALAAESDEVVVVAAGLAHWLRRPPGMIVA